jgi:cytochrome c5
MESQQLQLKKLISMKKIVIAFAALTLFAACQPKTTQIVEEVKKVEEVTEVKESKMLRPGTDAEMDGMALYTNNCGKCHDLPVIGDHSKERWNKVLTPMIKEAKLDASQGANVTAYVNWQLGL